MKHEYKVPNSAVKYILFQRTEYLSLTKTLLFRVIRKIIPFFNYNFMVNFEVKLKAKK